MIQHKRQGFTLLELLVSMALMSVITYACVWVFQQSMDLYTKSVGRGEVNQNLRVAEEKLRKDLLSCLSLDSGVQKFIMISRYGRDGYLNEPFPRDYLSFATMTRVDGSLTQAYVHYDVVNTESGMPLLVRYVQTLANHQAEGLYGAGAVFTREVVAQYCTMFQIEYLWKDPRPVGATFPSTLAHEKQVPDPGIFMYLHAPLNEAADGNDYEAKYATGGLNGKNLVEHAAGQKHCGAVIFVGIMPLVLPVNNLPSPMIQIPKRIGATRNELPIGAPSMLVQTGTQDAQQVMTTGLPPVLMAPYTHGILIQSPNLYGTTNLLPATHEPFDITADWQNGGSWGMDMSTPTTGFWDQYVAANPTRWPTYVPPMLRITMKVYSADRKIVNTRSYGFNIPTSGR